MLSSPPHASLVHPAIELAEQCRRASESAREAVRTAVELVHTSRDQREQREHWRLLLAERKADPDFFLSCCVYCARMRTRTEVWVTIPSGVRKVLRDLNVPFLSHGICPECLDRQLARY